jgi:hypothetical protein
LDPQRGAIGHELGHTFGLAHAQNLDGSIMYSWWNFPFVSLFSTQGNDEKSLLRNQSIFFSPQICSNDVEVTEINMPATVLARSQFNATFSVTNYGFCHWSKSLTILSIVRDDVWKVKSQALGQDIYPTQPYTFSLTLIAPAIKTSVAVYNSFWQMKSSNQFYGPQMGRQITITK